MHRPHSLPDILFPLPLILPLHQLLHEGHMERAEEMHLLACGPDKVIPPAILVGTRLAEAKKYRGCTGVSMVVRELTYIDYTTVFVLPLAHAFLYGILKNFWNMLLSPVGTHEWYVISGPGRALMTPRGLDLVASSEYSHKYLSVVDKRGMYTMNDWLHWLLTWSVYVVRDGEGILHPDVMEMWQLLRKAGLHYLVKGVEGTFTEINRKAGAEALLAYARLLDGYVKVHRAPTNMMTYNLHILICQLYKQESARGHPAGDFEFWVERLVQLLKESTKYRVSSEPEKVAVASMVFDMTLHDMQSLHNYLDFDQMKELRNPQKNPGNRDYEDDEENLLLQAGHVPVGGTLEACDRLTVELLKKAHAVDQHDGVVDLVQGSTMVHTSASMRGDEIITSMQYTREKTRCNVYVLIPFEDQGLFIGRIEFFFRFDSITFDSPTVKRHRCAVCTLWKAEALLNGEMYSVQVNKPDEKGILQAVPIGGIDCKMIVGMPKRPPGHEDHGLMYFLRPSNASRRM